MHVLGRMRVEVDGRELTSPPSGRPWALLAYLAINPGLHARGELAARFWPDVLDSSARASLRSAIWALRRALGSAAEGHLQADRDCVGLPGGAVRVDAADFDALVAAQRLEEAAELSRGELLEGFSDEWALRARDAHRERVLDVLERLAANAERNGDLSGAIAWTRRQCECAPLAEDAHRRLITRLAAGGDRSSGLVVYRTLAERLRRELGVAPSAPTRALADDLRAGAVESTASPPAVAQDLLPLVGRRVELAALERVWNNAVEGRGGAVVLRGEGGIGKTRLATELILRAASAGARTASCAALDLGGAAPFGLWAELIGELLASLPVPPLDAVWPEDLSRLAPDVRVRFERFSDDRPAVPPDLERTRLMEATVALIEWASRDRPLVLLFEDIHAADRSSLELTGYVARRIVRLPVLWVLTRRELPSSADADLLEGALRARGVLAAELALEPLPSRSVAELARSVAPLGDDDVANIVAACDGNALLAVETARALARGERKPSATLRGAARGAFAALPESGRQLAEFAAVAARELDRGEVELLPIQDTGDAASSALETGLLAGDEGRIGFRHALMRDAVYADLAAPRRLSLHEQWANLLLERDRGAATRRAAEVARHLRLAGRDQRAAEQLALAAADARSVAALVEAAAFLREALATGGDRPELLLELAEVEAWCGRREQAEAAFDRALPLLEGAAPLTRARAWLRCARWYHGPICVPRRVLECCEAALSLLDDAGLEALAERREGLAARAWAEAVAGDVAHAERLLVELHELVSRSDSDDLVAYDVGHARALALMRRGRFTESYAPSIAAGEAVTRAERPDLAYGCWLDAAGAAAAAGDFDRALEFTDRCRQALDGKGLAVLEVHVLAARSFLLLRLERLDEARAEVARERAAADQLDRPELSAMAAHDGGLVALAAGEFDGAAELLGRALVEGAPISRPLTRLARAEALVGAGRPDEAEAELRATALEPVSASDFPDALVPRLARLQGLVAAARGDPGLALARLHEAVGGWERQVTRATGAETMTAVLADLGRPVVGLVEPKRELARVARECEDLEQQGARHAFLS